MKTKVERAKFKFMLSSGGFYLSRPLRLPRAKKSHKSRFTSEEDDHLLALYKKYGDNWDKISSEMPYRNKRQCRERYKNYLNPSLRIDNWTEEEDQLLIQKFKEIGPHWNSITSFFPLRSSNGVRNRLVKLLKTKQKENMPIKELTTTRLVPQAHTQNNQIPSQIIYHNQQGIEKKANNLDTILRHADLADVFTTNWNEPDFWENFTLAFNA